MTNLSLDPSPVTGWTRSPFPTPVVHAVTPAWTTLLHCPNDERWFLGYRLG